MRGLTGKVALVTGGAAGVGYAVVERLRQDGARVAIIDRDETALLRAAAAFEGSATFVVDVLDEHRVQAVVAEVASMVGPVDILINNVGRTRFETFDDLDVERWRAEIDLNLTGSYIVARAVLPMMVQRRTGAIVNVASVNALVSVGNPAYSAAKAGLLQFTRQLATDYGPYGIRSNVVLPATINTAGTWDWRIKERPEVLETLRKWYPLGRIAEPQEIASAIVFLASAEASFVNGASLLVDGGLTAGNAQMSRDISGGGV